MKYICTDVDHRALTGRSQYDTVGTHNRRPPRSPARYGLSFHPPRGWRPRPSPRVGFGDFPGYGCFPLRWSCVLILCRVPAFAVPPRPSQSPPRSGARRRPCRHQHGRCGSSIPAARGADSGGLALCACRCECFLGLSALGRPEASKGRIRLARPAATGWLWGWNRVGLGWRLDVGRHPETGFEHLAPHRWIVARRVCPRSRTRPNVSVARHRSGQDEGVKWEPALRNAPTRRMCSSTVSPYRRCLGTRPSGCRSFQSGTRSDGTLVFHFSTKYSQRFKNECLRIRLLES